jgi:hypothetical protein
MMGLGIQAGRARDEMFIADWANNRNRKALLGSDLILRPLLAVVRKVMKFY